MNNLRSSLLRSLSLASLLALAPLAAAATDAGAAATSLPLRSAHGLTVGDARFTVERTLGRPQTVLPDGTAVYPAQRAVGTRSGQERLGDLHVTYQGQAVSALRLHLPETATPGTAVAQQR